MLFRHLRWSSQVTRDSHAVRRGFNQSQVVSFRTPSVTLMFLDSKNSWPVARFSQIDLRMKFHERWISADCFQNFLQDQGIFCWRSFCIQFDKHAFWANFIAAWEFPPQGSLLMHESSQNSLKIQIERKVWQFCPDSSEQSPPGFCSCHFCWRGSLCKLLPLLLGEGDNPSYVGFWSMTCCQSEIQLFPPPNQPKNEAPRKAAQVFKKILPFHFGVFWKNFRNNKTTVTPSPMEARYASPSQCAQ